MKSFSRLFFAVFMLVGTSVRAQVCEPNSRVYEGLFHEIASCKPLQRDGRARILPVGGTLFEEIQKSIRNKWLIVRVDGITSSSLKSGIIDRKVTLVTVERGCEYCGQGVIITTQHKLRSGDSLQLRTLSSSIKIEIVGIDEAEVALKIR